MEFLTNQVHIPAAAVLRGVTGLAAKALGLADRVGTLAPGNWRIWLLWMATRSPT